MSRTGLKFKKAIALLGCCFALMPFGHAAEEVKAPSLDRLANRIAMYDTGAMPQLEALYVKHYMQADMAWKLRWNLLACEASTLVSDGEGVARYLAVGRALMEHRPAYHYYKGYFAACEAGFTQTTTQYEAADKLYDAALQSEHVQGNPEVLAILLSRQANGLSDQGKSAMAMQAHLEAMRHMVLRPKQHIFAYPEGLLHFSIGRSYHYLGKQLDARASFEQAIAVTDPKSSLAWFIRFNYATVLSRWGDLNAAGIQLDNLNNNPPEFGPIHSGYFSKMMAEIMFRLERYDDSLMRANIAMLEFERVDMIEPLSSSMIYAGMSEVMLTDGERGWDNITRGQELMGEHLTITGGDWGALVESWSWMAEYHAERGNFEAALHAKEQERLEAVRLEARRGEDRKEEQAEMLSSQAESRREALEGLLKEEHAFQRERALWRAGGGLLVMYFLTRASYVLYRRRKDARVGEVVAVQDHGAKLDSFIGDVRTEKATGSIIFISAPNSERFEGFNEIVSGLREGDDVIEIFRGSRLLMLRDIKPKELEWRESEVREHFRGQKDVVIFCREIPRIENRESLLRSIRFEIESAELAREEKNSPGLALVANNV